MTYTAYATVDDLLTRYDWRDIAEIVSDDNSRLTQGALQTDTKVIAALTDASGEVEAALLVSGNYTTDQLAGLTGNSLGKLIALVCQIALANLMSRRSGGNVERYEQIMKIAGDSLQRLRMGENILNIPGKADAGLPSLGGPTTVAINRLNLVRDQTKNYFPSRRLPYNR